MAIVKKNLFSIILGVVAILAFAAKFYPLGGMVDKLKTDATAHAAEADKIKSLANKQRNLPIIKPGTSEPEPLPTFPTAAAVAAAHEATDLVAKAAEDVMAR